MYKQSSSVLERILAVCLVWFLPLAMLLACGTQSKKSADAVGIAPAAVLVKSEKFDAKGEIANFVQSLHDGSIGNDEPMRIHERFDRMMRERHEVIDRELRTQRDDHYASAKLQRDKFFSDAESARSAYSSGAGRKADSKTRAEFSAGQERDRGAYFAAENRRRRQFEDQLRDARVALENDVRELNGQFNTEYRALVVRREQIKASATPTPEATANRELIQEFRKIPKTPAVPLGPGAE